MIDPQLPIRALFFQVPDVFLSTPDIHVPLLASQYLLDLPSRAALTCSTCVSSCPLAFPQSQLKDFNQRLSNVVMGLQIIRKTSVQPLKYTLCSIPLPPSIAVPLTCTSVVRKYSPTNFLFHRETTGPKFRYQCDVTSRLCSTNDPTPVHV